jgi:ribosomal protein S18 acetylase RimI-like enzyme
LTRGEGAAHNHPVTDVKGDPVTLVPADEETLVTVYLAVRSSDLRLESSATGTRQLLAMQLAAQRQQYRRLFPMASWSVIRCGSVPVGWIAAARGEAEIRCLDIGLLEGVRRRGIAAHVLGLLQRDAAAGGLAVTLTVRSDNAPARAVYDRLGFQPESTTANHLHLTWRSASGTGGCL